MFFEEIVDTRLRKFFEGFVPHLSRPYTFSGRLRPDDALHRPIKADTGTPHASFVGELARFSLFSTIIPPTYVDVPGGYRIPQYAPTVVGGSPRYDPAINCGGNFMSSKFKPNNNCYNYACNIATNSFAQPGRMKGLLLSGPLVGSIVVKSAQADGLVLIGKEELKASDLRAKSPPNLPGHFVALLISAADATIEWPGDYHWVRCDDDATQSSWSQKDGSDEITNFDFAGSRISDPSIANWSVNQGQMIQNNKNDIVITYAFFAWMYCPENAITII